MLLYLCLYFQKVYQNVNEDNFSSDDIYILITDALPHNIRKSLHSTRQTIREKAEMKRVGFPYIWKNVVEKMMELSLNISIISKSNPDLNRIY